MSTVRSPLLCETETSEASGHVPVYDSSAGTYISRALTSADVSAPGSNTDIIVNSSGSFGAVAADTVKRSYIFFSVGSSPVAGGTVRFLGQYGATATVEDASISICDAITIKRLAVAVSVAPSVGETRQYEVLKNSSGTGLISIISDTATTSATNGSISFAEGDIIAIKETASAGAVASAIDTATVRYSF